MALYDSVADLALEIESYELERLEYVISPEFTRVTTVVHLHGAGEEGVGEDVTYTATDHRGTTKSTIYMIKGGKMTKVQDMETPRKKEWLGL